MDDNFLLTTPTSRELYHNCAKQLPIIDYHNHLNMNELAHNKPYRNLAALWLLSDPYKHRAMRICGVAEKYITGNAGEHEKHLAWMSVLPRLIGNPLYDWSILEMKRVFDIDLIPGVTDPEWIWKTANQKLTEPGYTPGELLARFGVEYAAPCALLTEDIHPFLSFENLAPSLRADNILSVTPDTVRKLEELTALSITTLENYFEAISIRLDEFERAGCRFSDHALDDGFLYYPDDGKNARRFSDALRSTVTAEDQRILMSAILRFLAGEYAKRGWTMQLHIGAQRFTSSRLRALAGPAGGFAGIGNCCHVTSLTAMLDDFEQSQVGMPRILLFTLNPADNAVMSVLSGSYSQDGVAGKVQQGPAWWWCDHMQGMREVFESISSFGVLSVFIGMTTDSRSILSFVRHEYFRRALCGWIGEKASRGEFPSDTATLKWLVEAICYTNAKGAIK